MGDTKIVYDEKFGIATFKREICAELGETFWNELVKNIELPDIDSECKCQCHNMYLFMKRFEEMADEEIMKKILYKVRHGLHSSQSEWAHKEFMEIGNLDDFLNKHLNDELNHFIELNSEKKDFYGQEISDEVLAFIKENPKMLAPVREGNKLYCMAFPCNMKEYLNATNEKMKRYHAKICNFREVGQGCSKLSFKITTIIIKYLHKPISWIFMRALLAGLFRAREKKDRLWLFAFI